MRVGPRLALAFATIVAQDDRLLNDLLLECLHTSVDLAEDRGGFVASHVVRYLDRFGRAPTPPGSESRFPRVG